MRNLSASLHRFLCVCVFYFQEHMEQTTQVFITGGSYKITCLYVDM